MRKECTEGSAAVQQAGRTLKIKLTILKCFKHKCSVYIEFKKIKFKSNIEVN